MPGGFSRQEQGHRTRGSTAAASATARNSLQTTPPPLQATLQQHLDGEVYKIRNMTESILYTFVPSAMKAIATGKESKILDASQATAIGAAAVAVATLLNAPSRLLEFLLSLPWSQFTTLYAEVGDAAAAIATFLKLAGTTPTEDAKKSQLVTCQLQNEQLLDCIMDFLYSQDNNHSILLPPLMCLPENEQYILENGTAAGKVQRAVLIQLQGCTPLHCAALRGNPVLVDVLLSACADPLAKNALGQLAMELVPKCSRSSSGSGISKGCRCVSTINHNCNKHHYYQDGPVECQSSIARSKLVKASMLSYRSSMWAWLHTIMLCVLCMFGLFGCPTTLEGRPEVEVRGQLCWEEKRKKALHKAHSAVLKLRTEASKGKEELGSSYHARKCTSNHHHHLPEIENSGISSNGHHLDAHAAAVRSFSHFSAAATILKAIRMQQNQPHYTSSSLVPEAHFLPKTDWSVVEINRIEIASIWAGLAESALSMMEESSECRTIVGSAIDTAVEELLELCSSGLSGAPLSPLLSSAVGGVDDVKHGLKKTKKKKSSGASMKLLSPISGKSIPHQQQSANSYEGVSSCYLATALYLKSKFLLKTDVQHSPTRESISRAQQCVDEWFQLTTRAGSLASVSYMSILADGGGGGGGSGVVKKHKNRDGEDDDDDDDDDDDGVPLEIQCLESWAKAAGADVLLVESLLGTSLPVTQSLSEAVQLVLQYDGAIEGPSIGRTMTKTQLLQLENALQQSKQHASDHIVALVERVSNTAREEIKAGERLQELVVRQRSNTSTITLNDSNPSEEQVAAAINAASKFPSLKGQVEQVKLIRERGVQRAAAQQQFDIAVETARSAPPSGIFSGSTDCMALDEVAFWEELNPRIKLIEAAIKAARQSSISVARGKKTLTDLQAQGAVVEAGKALEEALYNNKRAGSAALKAALSKAENIAAAAAAGAGAFTLGTDWLAPRLLACKAKLSLERAAEALARAVTSCHAVSDLPKLEAAILAAKKMGAHELDTATYAAAKELRNRLDTASRAKTTLDKALQKAQNKPEECILEAEEAILAAKQHDSLLENEICAAQQTISSLKTALAAEIKLAKALRDGAGVAGLSLAIKEAAAVGVQQVSEARKVLKLMHNLETAVITAATTLDVAGGGGGGGGAAVIQSLQAKISVAAAGGVSNAFLSEARKTLRKLLITDLRAELDAALKLTQPGSGSGRAASSQKKSLKKGNDPTQRLATLRAVLEKVDSILSLEESTDSVSSASTSTGPPPTRTISNASTATEGSSSSSGGNSGASTPPLMHELTTVGSRLRAQGSTISLEASCTSSRVSTPRLLNSNSNPSGGNTGSDSLSYLGRECSEIELRILVMSDIAAVWFEPRTVSTRKLVGAGEGEDDVSSSSSCSSEDLFSSEYDDDDDDDYDDTAAVRRMAQQARQRLYQEELEQARFEREKAEEARLHREVQLREKTIREALEKERAEKARAERVERLAAVEAQKTERRERERVARAERERERQAREAAAKEHFILLQRRRKMLADQSRAAHIAQLLGKQQALEDTPITSPSCETLFVSPPPPPLPLAFSHSLAPLSTENTLLSTKINATALLPSQNTTTSSLFGDLGGASWLSANPLTSNLPLSTGSTGLTPLPPPPPPHRTTSLNTGTGARYTANTTVSPSSALGLWGSADSLLGVTSGAPGGALASTTGYDTTLYHHRSLGSSGYDGASGLWSSIGSDGNHSQSAGGNSHHEGVNMSMLGLYPAQNTTPSSSNTPASCSLSSSVHPVKEEEAAKATAAHFRLPSETSLFDFLPSTTTMDEEI